MSRQSRTRRPAPDAEPPTLAPARPFPQNAPPAPSPGPVSHAGHDFRRVSVFPAAIQRKGGGDPAGMPDVPVAAGGGEAIPDSVRASMEGAFSQDFSDVRVHSGPEAQQVGALAYTRGSDIHFQPGQYDPAGLGGRELLGHELTHVVQQRAGQVEDPVQHKAAGAAPINADAGLEAEADALGAKAARGERAVVSGAGAGLQRKAEDAPIQRFKLDDAKNPDQYIQGDAEADNAFRLRMSNAMTQQSQMLATNDALPANVNATKPTVANPEGFASFQTKQLSEREKELDSLRRGKTNELTPNAGEFVDYAPIPGFVGPRPAPTRTPIADHFPVTEGTTEGKTLFNGSKQVSSSVGMVDQKTSTLSGGALGTLENKIQNPSQSPTLTDHQGHLKYPRQGLAARQASIMDTAEKADPLMRDLDATNTLPHHVDKNSRLDHGYLYNGDKVGGGKLTNGADEPYYAVGATHFTNVQKLLPQLTGPVPVAPTVNNEMNSRRGLWSEADVDPVKVTSHGYNHHGDHWANLANRGAERLLHTAPTSTAKTLSGRGGSGNDAQDYVSKPIDYRYHVTNDHYKSAVPVAPVQEDYATNHPYNSPYVDHTAPNSMLGHDAKELERLSTDASDTAHKSSYNRNADERERVKMEGVIEDSATASAYAEAEKSAHQSSYNRNADERDRVKLAGVVEDFENDQAVKGANESALKANSKREAEEEARTQADLKAFAPSDSIQSMYGMGKGGAEKWAAQQMEQQHLGVQDFLKSGEAKEPTPPMSESAMSMYS